jgi:AAA15 family ATPase/GTPase
MLVEFSVENFLSYKEKQTFSLKANVVRTNKEKTFGSSKDSLLKSIVFYGSNASGKSNMINSLLFSITLIKGSGNLNSDSTYFKDVRTPFKLDFKFLESKPSLFEYVFYCK